MSLAGTPCLVVTPAIEPSVVVNEIVVRFALAPALKAENGDGAHGRGRERETWFHVRSDYTYVDIDRVARAVYDAGFAVGFSHGGVATPISAMRVRAPPEFVGCKIDAPLPPQFAWAAPARVWTMNDLVGGDDAASDLRRRRTDAFNDHRDCGYAETIYTRHVWPHVKLVESAFHAMVASDRNTILFDVDHDRFFWIALQRHVAAEFRNLDHVWEPHAHKTWWWTPTVAMERAKEESV